MKATIDRIKRLIFTAVFILAVANTALAQDSTCDASILDAANNQYEIGLFDDSADELKPCLPDGFEQKEQRVSAYRLLALNYIVTDSLDQAQESIRQLLKTDSGYEPDLETEGQRVPADAPERVARRVPEGVRF